ncbi:MAG TPA: copper-binding protein [Fimbriiglobus sp.]|nr:copper-binding protein [Fimbriiglobus sp.]
MLAYLRTIAVASIAAAVLAGCQSQTGPTAKEAAKVYDITGKVVSLDPEDKLVELDHKDIPGLMKAMTMKFPVADAKLLAGLKPGDAVRGKLTAKSGEYVITALEKH